MFKKKERVSKRVFYIKVEECANYRDDGYMARVYAKDSPYFGMMPFYGQSREEVEGLALAFIKRVKLGETHYTIEAY